MKRKATIKIQIAIDKVIDLTDDYLSDALYDKARRILDAMRELETDISNAKSKNGRLTLNL